MDLEVDRHDLARTRLAPGRPLPDEPSAGAVLARIESFALTANNVTYAAVGDLLGYWQFFPASEKGWGRVPVWGHAEIVASSCDGVEVGDRFFGFWPMSSHVLLRPTAVGPGGFVDGTAHRAGLPDVYNRYERAADRAEANFDGEDRVALLRPLFTTAFLLDDWIGSIDEPADAPTIVISSASSKTALGLAYLLRTNARGKVIGLTSPAHVEYCSGTGCYDRVVAYADLPAGLGGGPAMFVDIAGDAAVLGAVHRHYGDDLERSTRVGFTHHDAPTAGDEALPGPSPELFFAPDHVRRRLADWGGAGFAERLASARDGFESGPGAALELVHVNGTDAVATAWRDVVAGITHPDQGLIAAW